MKCCISWLSFFDNVMNMEVIEAISKQQALRVAYTRLVQVEYDHEMFDTTEDLEALAFDSDGAIGAILIDDR